MKKIIGVVIIILLIPFFIFIISDIDRVPEYPIIDLTTSKTNQVSTLNISNDIELPKLPNGVGDRWNTDGSIKKKVGKIVLNGSRNWIRYNFDIEPYKTIAFRINRPSNMISTITNSDYISDRFNHGSVWNTDIAYNIEFTSSYLLLRILKSDLIPFGYVEGNDTTYVPAFKTWLNHNNTVVYYLLATPTIENVPPLPNEIDYYGNVIIDDGIIDYTLNDNKATINYIEGNITTVEDGEFIISKPTKIISYSNTPPTNYDLPPYIEYGTLEEDTYTNLLSFISNNSNEEIKIFLNDTIFPHRYKTTVLDDKIIISNDIEIITIYPDDTYTSTQILEEATYTLEGYHVISYTDGKFNNIVLAFFWIIPILLVGSLFYLLLNKKGD